MPLTNHGDDFAPDERTPIQEQMSKIGVTGGQTTRDKHGEEYYAKIGALGGRHTFDKYGKEFFSALGKKGAMVRAARRRQNKGTPGGE